MKIVIQIALASLLMASAFGEGHFPTAAWGASYLKNIPLAIEFMEANADQLSIGPPPSDDSDTTNSEIKYLKKISKERISSDIVLITKENLDPYRRFFEILKLDQASYPELNRLIQRTAEESYLPVLYFKQKYSRIRPYQVDRSLTTVVDGPPHASYPSGHATQGYLIALLLSDLFPKGDPRINRLMTLGEEIGKRREIAGVHYPSDTKAGIDLAIQLKPWVIEKPGFRQAFQAAKAEIIQQ